MLKGTVLPQWKPVMPRVVSMLVCLHNLRTYVYLNLSLLVGLEAAQKMHIKAFTRCSDLSVQYEWRDWRSNTSNHIRYCGWDPP